MRNAFLFLFLLLNQHGYSQYKLRIEVTAPAASKNDSVFIAGNFNNWDPANPSFYLSPSGDKLVYRFDSVKQGIYEYKFTRGSWNNVEVMGDGSDVKNRLLVISSDTTLYYTIAGWKDNFKPVERPHTASANVQVMDTSFHMSKLNRNRRIWIYLPPGYKAAGKRYPVLYMHDGQNLFDVATSGYGEWGVDEILDSLAAAGKPGAIVVGIDNGPKRMNEYNPWFFDQAGEGEGEQYVDFIIKELKPFIDKKYRTLSDKENTIIAGSSMGGLISYYAALKYPSVFGRAGVFSPAFWTAPAILPLTDSLASKSRGMFFFYMGDLEGEEMMNKMNDVIAQLGSSSNALLYTVTDPDGRHNEEAWRKWFAEFYLWVTSNGLNHIIR